MKPPPIRKRFYLLLEVLVAFALVAFLAIPLMRPHFSIAQEQWQALRRLQLEIHADNSFYALCEQLYENQIGWKELSYSKNGKGKTVKGLLSSVWIETADHPPQELLCSYTISVAKQSHKGRDTTRRTYRLLAIAITLTPKGKGKSLTYDYTLFAERLPKELARAHPV